MNNLLPSEYNKLSFTGEESEEIMRLSALNYSPREIAVYLGVNVDLFCKEANMPLTEVNLLMGRGKLVNKLKPEIALQGLAENGDIDAAKELIKLNKQRSFESIVQQLDEDEL